MCKYIRGGVMLPQGFSLENTKYALLHDIPQNLMSAFQWDSTSQGFHFWSNESRRTNLSDEARNILRVLVAMAEGI